VSNVQSNSCGWSGMDGVSPSGLRMLHVAPAQRSTAAPLHRQRTDSQPVPGRWWVIHWGIGLGVLVCKSIAAAGEFAATQLTVPAANFSGLCTFDGARCHRSWQMLIAAPFSRFRAIQPEPAGEKNEIFPPARATKAFTTVFYYVTRVVDSFDKIRLTTAL